MNVTINLSSDEERKLRERASASGDDLAGYIHRLIDRHIQAPDDRASLLAPVRQQFAESGMSEEELDSLVEEVREDVWREKHTKQPESS